MRRSTRIASLLGVCFLLASPLTAEEDQAVDLKVGDKAPVFMEHDDEGKIWNAADHVGKKIIVVFFFPAAMTGG